MNGGTIDIVSSKEGIEAPNLYITDGVIHLTSTDDGINATYGVDGEFDDGSLLVISGGYVHLNAPVGDGIDHIDAATHHAVHHADHRSSSRGQGLLVPPDLVGLLGGLLGGSSSGRRPLTFTVGTGQIIRGFDEAVVGMHRQGDHPDPRTTGQDLLAIFDRLQREVHTVVLGRFIFLQFGQEGAGHHGDGLVVRQGFDKAGCYVTHPHRLKLGVLVADDGEDQRRQRHQAGKGVGELIFRHGLCCFNHHENKITFSKRCLRGPRHQHATRDAVIADGAVVKGAGLRLTGKNTSLVIRANT